MTGSSSHDFRDPISPMVFPFYLFTSSLVHLFTSLLVYPFTRSLAPLLSRSPAYLLSLLLLLSLPVHPQNKKIAIFGSSVAKGSGDTTGSGGYAGMIKSLMEKRGWSVVNVSRGGDNTVKIMTRFEKELLPEKPSYVIIGLSLGNEGIISSSELNRKRIFERFRSNMQQLIRMCRENGMEPVVVNCYARNDFKKEQYDAVQKMNLLINTWDVPSINALGAIDNGSGNWAPGYWRDNAHPNPDGHREIFYAFVPSLFDAMAAGKKVPEKIRKADYLIVARGTSPAPLVYIPADTIHSFAFSFLVNSRNEGAIAAMLGETGNAILSLEKGKVEFQPFPGEKLSADTTGENKGWQYIVVSYRHATRVTAFFVNGKEIGTRSGLMDLKKLVVGGNGADPSASPEKCGYKDLLIFRSGLNAEEVTALYCDQLLQSSLEIYAPLDDPEFIDGQAAKNYAQSTSQIIIHGNHPSSRSSTEKAGSSGK